MYQILFDVDEFIKEDVPYVDLTTFAMGIENETAEITYHTREDCVVCGTEEVRELFDRLHIETLMMIPSGERASAGSEIMKGRGRACDILRVWKPGQNIIDHISAIATKTRNMVDIVKSVNPDITVLTTRKMFPGTKQLAIKGILAGGAQPHRLGISETVLIFQQHINMLGGMDAFWKKLPEIIRLCCGKKIFFETSDLELSLKLLSAGIDGIQFEKLTSDELVSISASVRKEYPNATLLAAGGINDKNAAEYARADIDGIVTTSLYTAKPIDVGTRIVRV